MKKMFIAALTAMAMCSISYAQDDDEYEESTEEAQPAQAAAEEEEEEAPAPKQEEKSEPRQAVDAGKGMLGFQLDMVSAFNGDPRFYVTYKIASDMEASLILGLSMKGESSYEANGTSTSMGDDATSLDVGVGFDYFLTKKLLPISVGGELVYSTRNALSDVVGSSDASIIEFNVLGGFRTEISDNFYITGKVGLSVDYYSWKFVTTNGIITTEMDGSRLDIGLKAQAMVSWFFM